MRSTPSSAAVSSSPAGTSQDHIALPKVAYQLFAEPLQSWQGMERVGW